MQSDNAYKESDDLYFDSKEPDFFKSKTPKEPSKEVVNMKLELGSNAIPEIAYSCS